MQELSSPNHDFGTSLIGNRVYHLETVTSTNTRLLELVESEDRSGLPEITNGFALWADEQTAGRGRINRTWISPKHMGLWMSFYLQPGLEAHKSFILTFLAAVAVVKSVQQVYQLSPKIKWPNDVLLNRQKICGILTETRVINEQIEHAVVGVGINLNQTRDEFDKNKVAGASSLLIETGRRLAAEEVLRVLLKQLDDYYVFVRTGRFSKIIETWKAYAAFVGDQVVFSSGTEKIMGIYKGIDNKGGLIIEMPDRSLRKFYSGSLSPDG